MQLRYNTAPTLFEYCACAQHNAKGRIFGMSNDELT